MVHVQLFLNSFWSNWSVDLKQWHNCIVYYVYYTFKVVGTCVGSFTMIQYFLNLRIDINLPYLRNTKLFYAMKKIVIMPG